MNPTPAQVEQILALIDVDGGASQNPGDNLRLSLTNGHTTFVKWVLERVTLIEMRIGDDRDGRPMEVSLIFSHGHEPIGYAHKRVTILARVVALAEAIEKVLAS